MKICHIAALAALGWYLMAPPNRDIPPSAPLSKWEVRFSFDKARDCEIALGNTLANVKPKLGGASSLRIYAGTSLGSASPATIRASRRNSELLANQMPGGMSKIAKLKQPRSPVASTPAAALLSSTSYAQCMLNGLQSGNRIRAGRSSGVR